MGYRITPILPFRAPPRPTPVGRIGGFTNGSGALPTRFHPRKPVQVRAGMMSLNYEL